MRGLPVSMSSSLASSRPSRTCDPGSSSRGRPVLSASARIALSAARIRTKTRRASAAAFSSAPPAMLWMTFSPPALRHPTSSCRFMSWFPSKINTQSQSPSSVSPMGQNSGCCCGSGSGSGSAEADAARGFAVAVNVGCCGARVRMMTWPSATEPSPAAVNSSSGSSAMPTSDGRAVAAPSGARPSTSNDMQRQCHLPAPPGPPRRATRRRPARSRAPPTGQRQGRYAQVPAHQRQRRGHPPCIRDE